MPKNIKGKNKKYNIFLYLVSFILVLGSIFSTTYAYLSGTFTIPSEDIANPYFKTEFYYSTDILTTKTSLTENSIWGVIDNDGVATLKINETSISGDDGVYNLPLYLTNSGNIDGKIDSIFAIITFYEGVNDDISQIDTWVESYVSNDDYLNDGYYITLNESTGYTIDFNSFFSFEDVELNKDETTNSQILKSITFNNLQDTELCGKTFVISFTVSLTQK